MQSNIRLNKTQTIFQNIIIVYAPKTKDIGDTVADYLMYEAWFATC